MPVYVVSIALPVWAEKVSQEATTDEINKISSELLFLIPTAEIPQLQRLKVSQSSLNFATGRLLDSPPFLFARVNERLIPMLRFQAWRL